MRVFLDTEFVDNGFSGLWPISIGLVRQDGEEYYAEFEGRMWDRPSRSRDWLAQNVVPHLTGEDKPASVIRDDLIDFCGPDPEFWGYFCAYDWVIVCQLFGRLIDVPPHWPQRCNDLAQALAYANCPMPLPHNVHHALEDARWCKRAFGLTIGKAA